MVRRLSILLVLMVLLAACSAPTTPAPTAAPAASAVPTAAPVAENGTCASGTRSITGAFGPVCIPLEPQRIIALNEGVMANLLALGVTPIGVSDYANRDYTGYLGDTTTTIASVGTPDGPNLEAMLALDPDLILGMSSDVDEELLPLLSAVAPVALSDDSTGDWRSNFLFAGEVLGQSDKATELLERTDARLAELREAYAAQAETETVAIIRSRADAFNIYNRESFIAELSKEAGVRMPASFDEIEPWNTMSLENITMLTSGRLFVMVRNERESGAFRELSAGPLWQTLPAVQNDAVEIVNWNVWVAGWNVIGANLVIDDLYFYLLGTEAPTANPFRDLIIPDFGPQYDQVRLGVAAEDAAASAPSTFPLTITDARGTVTLDAPAQRVVALEWTYVENLLALGVQPVGVADIAGYESWVNIPATLSSDVQDVGTRQEPNLEQIAALQPDLIIAPSFRIDANYEELQKIAPVLAFDPYPTDATISQYDEMIQTFQSIAQAVGREAEGDAVIAQMYTTFTSLGDQLSQAGYADAPFVLAQAFSGGSGAQVRLMTGNAMAVQIMEQLGLSNAWDDAEFQQYGFSTVSVEALPQLGESHFFYVVQDDDNVFAASAVQPLWQSLAFVQAGNDHALGGDTWLFGGPLSAEVLAEKVTTILLVEERE